MSLRPIDADNHYYESLDAFTRHLDRAFKRRGVRAVQDGKRVELLIGGRVNRFVPNPTFNPIIVPGCLDVLFRGKIPEGVHPASLMKVEPIRAEYRDRDARIAVADAQGLDAVLLFPTLGCGVEEALRHDIPATMASLSAFNRWLEEDWGYEYEGRIFASPYISLADIDVAVEELERALSLGARTICMRPAAPTTIFGPLTPGDPYFDPFWARVNEAGITVVVHAGDSGYSLNGYAKEGFSAEFSGSGRPSIGMMSIERAIYDFLASLIFDQLFERFPNLRVASVENGAEFLPDLFRKFKSINRKIPGLFQEDPVETFRRHIWINPFWEDDPYEIVEMMGADRVVFGSDWPHIEGLPSPRDYLVEVKELDEDAQRLVMHDNAAVLNTPQPL
jgi:predicted TIM-barrel fold metal-dependent hydrolase